MSAIEEVGAQIVNAADQLPVDIPYVVANTLGEAHRILVSVAGDDPRSSGQLRAAQSALQQAMEASLAARRNLQTARESLLHYVGQVLCGGAVVDTSSHPRVPLSGGGRESKEIITVPGRSGTAEESYIRRPFSDVLLERWRDFRQAGLRVPDRVASDSDGGLCLSDVKADGSETYGLGMVMRSRDEWDERSRPEIDNIFERIVDTPQIRRQVQASLYEYVDRATVAGIGLLADCMPELLVHPNGSWEWITLDLRGAVKLGDLN